MSKTLDLSIEHLAQYTNPIVLDVEIAKSIPSKFYPNKEGIEYCSGWKDYSNMGISVVGVYDIVNASYRLYGPNSLYDLQQDIEAASHVIGFNNHNFDNVLLSYNCINVPEHKTVDILRIVWESMGLDPDVYVKDTHGGVGLHELSMLNLGEGKTGNGTDAAVLYQNGQLDKLYTYNINDLRLTYMLFRLLIRKEGNGLKLPNGSIVTLF